MNAFLIYMLKVAVLSALFIALYHLLLSRETFHRTNRVILVSSLVLSYILPFAVITVHREGAPTRMVEITTGNRVEEPADEPYQPVITSGSVYSSAPREETVQPVQTQNLSQVIEVSTKPDTPMPVVKQRKPIQIDWWKVLAGVYLIGLLAVLIYRILCTTKVVRIIRKADVVEKNPDFTLVRTRQSTHPFNWMRYIVLPWEGKAAGQTPVLDHEKAHLAHHHSIELLWTDLLSALQWFNPALLLFRRDLYSIHEFQADADVLSKGYDRKQYQYLMLDCATDKSELRAVNTFRKSTLEGRIDMINRKRSTGSSILKVAYIPVLLLLSLGAFAETVYDGSLDETIEVDNYVRIDGLWYKFKGNQVRVVSRKTRHDYPAHIVIPDTIIYKSVKYPVTSISPYAFYHAVEIKSVSIPSTVKEIESDVFCGCTGLEKVNIPQSVKKIGDYAFMDCSSLKSITIPASVKTIGSSVFIRAGLEAVTVDKKNKFYDSRDNCNAIIETATNTLVYGTASTVIPNSVTAIGPEAFDGMSSLKSIVIPKKLTQIRERAFRGCTALESIELPESVKELGYGCFMESGIKDITINGNVEGLSNAFAINNSLESITFGPRATVIEIPNLAPELKNLYIPATVREIILRGSAMERNIESITVDKANPVYDSREDCNAIIETKTDILILGCANTVIPGTVTAIAQNAFSGTKIKEINIPASVTSITYSPYSIEDVFASYCPELERITVDPANPKYDSRENCNAIIETRYNNLVAACKTTVIPATVRSISSFAFRNLKGLKEIVIPDGVTTIKPQAFMGCSDLEKITIGAGIISLTGKDDPGIINLPNLKEIKVSPGNKVYDSRNDCNAIIETATGRLILGCANTVVPDGVTTIAGGAFRNNTQLTELRLPASVNTIEDDAFYNCSNLREINLENVTNRGERAFEACRFFSGRVDSICGYMTFRLVENDATLIDFSQKPPKEIIIPGSFIYSGKEYTVTAIGNNTFNSLDWIESVSVPGSVTTIGRGAFQQCSKLKKVILHEGLKTIESDCFAYCSALESIKLPSTLEQIGRSAFTRSGLKSLEIPESVTKLGSNITLDCKNLTSLSVKSGNTNYDSRNRCNAIINTKTNVLIEGCRNSRIPDNVIAIGPHAFAGADGLKSIEIPSSVKYIFYRAFAFCPLEKIEIPASVELLEEPFFGCGKIRSIKVDEGNKYYSSPSGCNAIISNAKEYLVVKDSKASELMKLYFDGLYYGNQPPGKLVLGCRNTVIPESSIYTIARHSFAFCEGLERIDIPDCVDYVESNAFLECPDLKEIHFPASVKELGKSDYCPKLETITIAKDNPVYYCPDGSNAVIEKESDILLIGCNGTVIPKTVKAIDREAFAHLSGLKSIVIPNSVERICYDAFTDCVGLESVSIPRSVKYIGIYHADGEPSKYDTNMNAFTYCPNLKKITVAALNPVFDSRGDCNAIIESKTNTLLVGCSGTDEPETVNHIYDSAYDTNKDNPWKPDYLSTKWVFPDGDLSHSYIIGDPDD